MERTRIGEGARRIAASVVRRRRAERHRAVRVDEGRPPAWLTELDDHDAAEELSFALYSDLGELVEVRTGVTRGGSDE